MEIRMAVSPRDLPSYDTKRLRETFRIGDLFSNELRLVYSHEDRIIVGGVAPTAPVALPGGKELGSDYFCQRRELGVINIGGTGTIETDGKKFVLEHRDGMYIGMGTEKIVFNSLDPKEPAKFYLNSAPAHRRCPTVLIRPAGEAGKDTVVIRPENIVPLGTLSSSNSRTIRKYIVPGQVESCQLCMGITSLNDGSVWNSMPCHTHDRRMEVYMYFGLAPDDILVHYMGEPDETRHLILRNEEAVISPSWSIHAGSGTHCYSFVWGMCGENQVFDDMDHVSMRDLY